MSTVLIPTIKSRAEGERTMRRGVPLHAAPGAGTEDVAAPGRKPPWLKVRVRQGENFA
ncbi:MAG: hypothetical protein QOD46_1315, partial [Actinomycetota bacterium]|nr:hypothetical protein [Actinomycetota bacterium]